MVAPDTAGAAGSGIETRLGRMATFFTKPTIRRPRAFRNSPHELAEGEGVGTHRVYRRVENYPDIGFRIEDVWRGGGRVEGDLSWSCGNCRHVLLDGFAKLPFRYQPVVVQCGACGVDSEAFPEDSPESG